MPKGDVFKGELFQYEDPYSGCQVTQLTNAVGHSNHLYFTDPCWFNDGRSLVFVSDRSGHGNLFRYDLDAGRMTQLTDLTGLNPENERVFDHRPQGAYSAANDRYYYWWQNRLFELDVDTLAERVVYEAPPDKVLGIHAITSADGLYICNAMRERTPGEAQPEIEYPYSRFRVLHQERPLTQIIRVEVATGQMDVIHEDRRFITHVNLSPTNPNILTFCHEGPWHLIDQRIWGLNILTGDTWKIRPQSADGYAIGHEYWLADGEHLGYHGFDRSGEKERHVFGTIKWDNSDYVEQVFPFHSVHFHSLDQHLIVGDGTRVYSGANQPFIQLFRWDGEQYVGPKILAMHRSTFNGQQSHCHPRFTPDGRAVLYASDLTGYANMYLVTLPGFDDLPDLDPDVRLLG